MWMAAGAHLTSNYFPVFCKCQRMFFKDVQHLSETWFHYILISCRIFHSARSEFHRWQAFKEKSSLKMQLYSSVKDNTTQRNDGHQREVIREAKSQKQSLIGFKNIFVPPGQWRSVLWDTVHMQLCCWGLADVTSQGFHLHKCEIWDI